MCVCMCACVCVFLCMRGCVAVNVSSACIRYKTSWHAYIWFFVCLFFRVMDVKSVAAFSLKLWSTWVSQKQVRSSFRFVWRFSLSLFSYFSNHPAFPPSLCLSLSLHPYLSVSLYLSLTGYMWLPIQLNMDRETGERGGKSMGDGEKGEAAE